MKRMSVPEKRKGGIRDTHTMRDFNRRIAGREELCDYSSRAFLTSNAAATTPSTLQPHQTMAGFTA